MAISPSYLVLGDLANPILVTPDRGRLAAFRHHYIVAQHSEKVRAAQLSGGDGEASNHDAFLIPARGFEHLAQHISTSAHQHTSTQHNSSTKAKTIAVQLDVYPAEVYRHRGNS